jgi:tetratricopeptide (TPR) repeat protein
MSEADIVPGQRWNEEISVRLRETHFGIICLTPENLAAPWLLFEAGAIAKAVESARVVPLLFGIKKTELSFPLAQFHAVETDRDGFLALASAINRGLGDKSLDATVLASVFNGLWPGLRDALMSVEPVEAQTHKSIERSEREILEEVLSGVRGIQRSIVVSPGSAIVGEPVDWEDYYLRGVNLANSRASRETNLQALHAYSAAIALAPDSLTKNLRSRLFAYRGAVLKRLGRLEEAWQDLDLAQRWATEDREINDALYNRACVAAMSGDKDGAFAILEQLVGRDPGWIDIVKLRASYFGSLYHHPRFATLIGKSVDRSGGS